MARYHRNRIDNASPSGARDGFVITADTLGPEHVEMFETALCAIRIARRLGILGTRARKEHQLPYDDEHDNLVFDAPIASWIAGVRIRYLRGWKQFQSCVKGFNGLGLLGELVVKEMRRIASLDPQLRLDAVREFISSRKVIDGTKSRLLFDAEDVATLADNPTSISDFDLAIWRVCARRTIVCSTSSNMGISLHEILRHMQAAKVKIGEKLVPLLNFDEGQLIIWCPDEQADFMSSEKAEVLRRLEAEEPKLTTLHTYINRKQRDPGALADALNLGGYFFPTNPQSKEELQNLFANALRAMATERQCKEAELVLIPSIRQVFDTIGCSFENGRLLVHEGIESGMHGLMVAYLLMLDESLQDPTLLAISTWNQASIGAALAAAVIADEGIRDWERLTPQVRKEIAELLPNIAQWTVRQRLGVDIKTRIHGVFDLANLQSLAQLLGVVVERHSSGRGIAYVGLGSSSYSNGNSCYDILKNSEAKRGPFHGKTTFHPATHTLNPVAQAIVIADDVIRVLQQRRVTNYDNATVESVARHVRKPESAGAAALAGYLLTRLDGGTLSIEELAYPLRRAGFTKALFLEMAGYSADEEGASWFVQEASEEGELMASFAESFLACLEVDIAELQATTAVERRHSQDEYRRTPIDPPDFEALDPVVNIYLTGDNCAQPTIDWFKRLLANLQPSIDVVLAEISGQSDTPIDISPHSQTETSMATRMPSSLDLIGHAAQIFRNNADRDLIIDVRSGKSWTYGEVFNLARQIAGGLITNGAVRGDRIALLLPNGVPLAASYFACLMSGLVAVPINPALTAKEIGTVLDLSRAKLLIVANGTVARLTDVHQERIAKKVLLVREDVGGFEANDTFEGTWIDATDTKLADWGVPFSDCQSDTPFLILFTSGTTALPKGVVHSARSELGNAVAFNAAMGFDQNSRFLHVWPMAYSSGILNTFLSPFMAEGTVVLAEQFDARTALGFWNTVIDYRVNTLWLSPTMIASLLTIDRDTRGPSYCKEYIRTVCCGTAALPLAVKQKFEQRYGVELFESYGLTELLILTANVPRYPRRDRSVGCALPGIDIRIGRPEGDDVLDALGGEVLARTPYAMVGYVNSLTGAVDAIDTDAYFPTGDIGRLDADGNLSITGRKKDLIVRGGQTISPAAVREVLLAAEGVEDAYVVGLPHSFYGEEVAAAVRLKAGVRFEDVKSATIEHCRKELNAGAVPTVLAELNQFPLGSTGKVLAREIAAFLVSAQKIIGQGR
jgi:acyl-CoA synthetase (AMP-forming)/AMP-acid ligase II